MNRNNIYHMDSKSENNSPVGIIFVVILIVAVVFYICLYFCCLRKHNDSDDHENPFERRRTPQWRESVALVYPIAHVTLVDNESDLPVFCIVIPVATSKK